ncbi:MAG: dependent protein [Chthoniobacter sp.]|jgi:pyridoxal phosphate enzyme (YggS family)|nr:dependent protein [Chthoniobacter sp.]
MSTLAERLEAVRGAIAEAAARAGRNAADVALVAVSKAHPPEAISEALSAGQFVFGESRIQEARAKAPLLPGRCRWHFIGHLQKNKIRQALPLFELFHGIDSLELARDLDRIAGEAGVFPKVLLEINVAGEATKFGFPPVKLRAQLEDLLALERLQIDGLMCLPPPGPRAEDSRRYFVLLRELRDALQAEARLPLPQLSMGMSGDFAVAVEEGATLVRVGTAIFGERSGKTWKPAADAPFSDD